MLRKALPLSLIAIGSVLIGLGVVGLLLISAGRIAHLLILALPAGVVLSVVGWLTHAFSGARATLRFSHVIEIAAGLLLILFCQFLVFVNGLGALLALAVGTVLLILGCFPWACKLPATVAVVAGGTLLALALSARQYVPIFVPFPPAGPDDVAGLIIHLINTTLGIPGGILIGASMASPFRRLGHGTGENGRTD